MKRLCFAAFIVMAVCVTIFKIAVIHTVCSMNVYVDPHTPSIIVNVDGGVYVRDLKYASLPEVLGY